MKYGIRWRRSMPLSTNRISRKRSVQVLPSMPSRTLQRTAAFVLIMGTCGIHAYALDGQIKKTNLPKQAPASQKSALSAAAATPASMESEYEIWLKKSPKEKAKLRSQWERFRSLPPEKRKQAYEKFHQWKGLPQERRKELRERYNHSRQLPRRDSRERSVRPARK